MERERSIEMRDQDDSPARERWEEGHDNLEESGVEKTRESGKYRSKDRSKSSSREEKEPKSRDRDRSKTSDVSKDREKDSRDSLKDLVPSKDTRADDRDDRERDKGRDKAREKDTDREKYRVKERDIEKDHKARGRKRERERERDSEKDGEREREKERGKEKIKDREKDRDGAKDRGKEKDRDRHKEREQERENDRDIRDKLEKEKGKDRSREERETDQKKERSHERDKASRKQRDEEHHRSKDENSKLHGEDGHHRDITKQGLGSHHDNDSNGTFKHEQDEEGEPSGSRRSAVELEERILKMKEERLTKKSEGSSEVLSWVSKSRKLEEKRNAEKEKALQLSKIFEEQDNIQGDSEDEASAEHTAKDLAGVKILHGLDKVVEGGAVVLTLKDQSILADGDINQEVDMLENIEIGEQKRRTEAYGAAKKKTGTYVDKFNEEPGSEKKMLPQYDDPNVDEGVTLDARGRFSGEAEKKLEELRRRIDGVTTKNQFEDLNLSTTMSSDYFTHEEMLQFKKPKKKKSLRKKNKLDLDALEAEAIASGLGAGDLGSRNDGKRQALKEEQERSAAEKRSNAYQSAYEKADEASKALRLEKNLPVPMEEDDTPVFGDDDDDLRKSLERARKLSLSKKEEGAASGPQSIAHLASSTGINSTADTEKPTYGESQENKVVFTEMEEFVWGLQLDEESHKPDGEDVFMEEDVAPRAPSQEPKEEDGGWAELKDTSMGEASSDPDKEEVVPDETIHEVAVGKGLSGVLSLLKERGALKETVEWGGRNMDKKKSKLVGIYANDGQKEIRIDRTDEYGRILTPKEAFRLLSHKFHGKGPGKMKQEKRMRQYQEELKIKKMKNADTPSSSAERMREAQAQLKMPYLVISGSVKPGQTSDPRSGFATVEKDFAGGLTPMLGDRKVEHFLGIKRKPEGGDMGPPKKPGGGGDIGPPKEPGGGDMGPPKPPKS